MLTLDQGLCVVRTSYEGACLPSTVDQKLTQVLEDALSAH